MIMVEIKFPLDVNGYHFTSWKDAAEQLGYNDSRSLSDKYSRMKDTHSLEEIFIPNVKKSIFPLDVNGYHFTGWKDASKQLSYFSKDGMRGRYYRMKDTHSLEEIFIPNSKEKVKKPEFPLDINGYHFTSWCDATKQLGYNDSRSLSFRYSRMKDTHSLEEIFIPNVKLNTIFPLDVNGYHFTSWADTAKQLGYTYDGIIDRYSRMKDTHSLEEICVPNAKLDTIFPLDVNGYHFTSWEDASEQLGYISMNARYHYMKDTYSLDEIFVPSDKKESIFPLDVNGYHFTSWKDSAEQLGYGCRSSLCNRYNRMKDNYSLDEIFIPKVEREYSEKIFPLDICGYHFISWTDAEIQLKCDRVVLMRRYRKGYTLMEVFGFSIIINKRKVTKINEYLTCYSKISDNLYKCKNKKIGLYESYTYEELNDMWRKYHNVKIVKG